MKGLFDYIFKKGKRIVNIYRDSVHNCLFRENIHKIERGLVFFSVSKSKQLFKNDVDDSS